MFAKDKVSQSMLDAVNKVLETQQQVDEAFPTVADAAKRMADAEKKKFDVKKISTGTVYTKKHNADKDDVDDELKSRSQRARIAATTKTEEKEEDCVTPPQAKSIAKKEVGKHEKGMHKESTSFQQRLIESMYGKKSAIPMDEKEMSPAQSKKKEKIVMSMKDREADFKKKYGKRWKDVMYATATKMAMKEESEEINEADITTDMLTGRQPGGKDPIGKDGNFKSYKVALKPLATSEPIVRPGATKDDITGDNDENKGETKERQKVTTSDGHVEIKFDDKLAKTPYNYMKAEEVKGELKHLRAKAEKEKEKDVKDFTSKLKTEGEVEESGLQEKNESHTHAAHYENGKGEWTGMNLLVAKDDEDAIKQAHAKCKDGCRLSKVERHIAVKEEVEQIDEAKEKKPEYDKNKVVNAVQAAMLKSRGNVIAGRAERAAARLAAKVKHGMKEEADYEEDDGPLSEEQLDELSKGTLASYTRKAVRHMNSASSVKPRHLTPAGNIKKGSDEKVKKLNRRINNRDKGINKAVSRLAKEEVEQIDELKKSTVSSYIRKKFGKMSDEPDSKNQYGYAKKDAKGIRDAGLRMSGVKATQKEEVELDEAKTQSKKEKDKVVGAVTKAMRQSYANVMQGRNERAAARMNAKIKNNMKEEAEQIDEISKELAGKYLTAPQGKGANKYKVSMDKSVYPNYDAMSKHDKSVGRALKRSGGSALNKKPSYYKEDEQMDEMKNTPTNKPSYKLKSFSAMKKEMLGKDGMTSEETNEEKDI